MTVTAKTLIQSKYAPNTQTTQYTTPVNTRTIIDKFTATNTDTTDQTISIHIVPSSGSATAENKIISAVEIAQDECRDFPELQNHILSAGDFISVVASVASKIVIRSGGREVT